MVVFCLFQTHSFFSVYERLYLSTEVHSLVEWFQKMKLNVNKTKELFVDFRRQQKEQAPIHIDGATVEKVKSFKILGVHIIDNLNGPPTQIVWRVERNRRLMKFGSAPKTLTNFYTCTIESILSGCITAWYDNCTVRNRRALQRVVRFAQRITEAHCLPFRTSAPPGVTGRSRRSSSF